MKWAATSLRKIQGWLFTRQDLLLVANNPTYIVFYYFDFFSSLFITYIDCSCDDREKLPAEISDEIEEKILDDLMAGKLFPVSVFFW